MIKGMKIKTSVTLEADLLKRVDNVLHTNESRSAFLMDAAQQLAQKRERTSRDQRDLEKLNANAEALKKEAIDNLDIVADLFREQGETQP